MTGARGPNPKGCLWVDDPKRKGLADRLRAIQYVQLAQRLLHVVLHGERADLQDHADLDVALAVVDPLQDLGLARREQPRLRRLVGAAVERPRDLGAYPCGMQVRDDQVREVRLLGADRARAARKDEEARHRAGGVVRAVREDMARSQARELARERR